MDLDKLQKLEDVSQRKEEARVSYNEHSLVNIELLKRQFQEQVIKNFATFVAVVETPNCIRFTYKDLQVLFYTLNKNEIDNNKFAQNCKAAFSFNLNGKIFNLIDVYVLPILSFPAYPDKVIFMSPVEVKIKLALEELDYYQQSLENERSLRYKYRIRRYNFNTQENEYEDFTDLKRVFEILFK